MKRVLAMRDSVARLKNDSRKAFEILREELDDHLQSINENTNELQANFEYLKRLEARIALIETKLEALAPSENAHDENDILLTDKEKDVYLLLSNFAGVKSLSYLEMARALRQSSSLVQAYVINLIEKGIPIKKRYKKGEAFVELDPLFRDMQERNNLLRIAQQKVESYA